MAKPNASEMVEFSCKELIDWNWNIVKDICDMEWRNRWQRKFHIYKQFKHMADLVWQTYKNYDKWYNKGICE